MLSAIPDSALPILIGISVMTMMEILLILSTWKHRAMQVHQLKFDTHTLRLRVKRQSAERIVAEERHRASFTNHLAA